MEFTGYYELFWEMVTGMLGKFIPDEITVMTVGAQIANTGADFFAAFAVIYPVFFIVSCVGYLLGAKAFGLMTRNLGLRADLLSAWRGSMGWLLAFCIFLPIIRHIVPILAGASRMPLRQFLLFFLPSSIIWTLHYLVAGYWFSDQLEILIAGVYQYSKITLTIVCLAGFSFLMIRQLQRLGGMKEPRTNKQPPVS
ncbi:DedA family protein [Brevibacillus sp. DP1.3A]|uniref:DedA family protein n=1 Tax=Brevibacillus sp. DP1.3A TaxID=2738867 RepID=UPI00156B17DC|nr:VTT domain-containing protein [Brevibacillus sp. DP1.3A]UED76646.1 VTT domain-containing protein [Brevibacillus sp. DP1.3A]